MQNPAVRQSSLRAMLAFVLLPAAAAAAQAQTAAPAAAASAPAGAASAPAPAAARPEAGAGTQKVEITGGRLSDTEERRRSTASKIVIGREEIDKFGDASVGEVLRRLPGVTTPGAPGRGGPPRMRGLGNGFTQLLIDGQPIPRGFSLQDLTPEQVERIEILRAPTAETGARAIAGTINIITREGFKVRLNNLRIGTGYENGQFQPGINFTHNDNSGALTYNITASLFKPRRDDESSTLTVVEDANTGAVLEERRTTTNTRQDRIGANVTGRLTWRLSQPGDTLTLAPSVFHTEVQRDSRYALAQIRNDLNRPEVYETATAVNESSFTNATLGLNWRQRVGDVRLQADGNGRLWKSSNDTVRDENNTSSTSGLYPRQYTDKVNTREKSFTLKLKANGLVGGGGGGGGPQAKPEHDLVSGLEIEGANRDETRLSTPDVNDFGDNLKASTLRLAAYAQDEWQLNQNWGLHLGLRWEGINTQGDTGQGDRPTNRSSVWTPLLHAVYKPDPKSQDQVRISLTRSYRNPALGALIARPTINRTCPLPTVAVPVVPGCGTDPSNRSTNPDSAGNPDLLPELATGLDIAFERYLSAGGLLSANLFHRSISNLIRADVSLETVSWSPSQRYVRRQRNIGDATTTGIELEAKFRLDQVVTGAWPVDLRSNLSLYRSRVNSVPGPDNRLDQQAKATANLGADYRMRGLPLTVGGNLNWVPGYITRLDVDETTRVSTKQVWDAYVLWTINPAVAVRLLGNNLDPRAYATTGVNESVNALTAARERTTTVSSESNYVNVQLRLELKL